VSLALSGMVLLTAGSIIWGTYVRSRETILINSEDLILQAARETRERVQAYLDPAARTVSQLAQLEAQGSIDLDDLGAAEGVLFALQQAQPEISMLGYGAADGRFLMVERTGEGALWTKEVIPGVGATWRQRAVGGGLTAITATESDPDDAYDPRTRPWYQAASAAGGLIWTDVYVFWSRQEPGITVAVPAGGHGIVSADVRLRELSGFLESLTLSDNAVAFIIDQRGHLIATSEGEALLADRALLAAADSVTPSVAALTGSPAAQAFIAGQDAPPQTVRLTVDDAPHIGGLVRLSVSAERDWLIGVAAPESDFLGALHEANRRNATIGAVLMLIALLLSRILARWIATTLQVLVTESARIRSLQLDRGGQKKSGARFQEVVDVIDAFEDMKTGLRAFQRYLPVNLVRVLLEEQIEPRLGGVDRQISLYFSDIGGFTTISERLGPRRMAERLGDYLGMLSTIIQEREGTVVQFVGDEVMAMWGAPLPVDRHADRVCETALTVQERIPGLWTVDETHPLMHTRIGLHTATVVVGHFGARDRMYYGAIGDGVNLASRLESANKQYGTSILVSDTTHGMVTPDTFVFRLIDRIIAKGKQEPTTIYELIGRHGEVSAEKLAEIATYEAAFAHYQARRFAEAAQVLAALPDDAPAGVLRQRCQHYLKDPPPPDWDGVHAMTTK
jgi:adenylate cyclase